MEENTGGALRRLSLSPLTSPRGTGSQLNAFLTPAGTVRERNSDLLDLKTVRLSASLATRLSCRMCKPGTASVKTSPSSCTIHCCLRIASTASTEVQAYVNEKVAPEVLEYQGDLVDRVVEQIRHQV